MMIDQIAVAPVSWGVNEVPGWGHQLDVGTVLGQMSELGITATESGPDGFLGDDQAEVLARFRLTPVGGFVPAVFHIGDPMPQIEVRLDELAALGASTVIYAASTGLPDYAHHSALDEVHWARLLSNLERARRAALRRGLHPTLHPHLGTVIETADEVRRVLEDSPIDLCLDTGHLLLGGSDPADLARERPDRVGHVHLKDVSGAVAARYQTGELSYHEAVAEGLFVPLGDGIAGIDAVIDALDASGYRGWYVLEQDRVLYGPDDAAAACADVRRSRDALLARSPW